MGKFFESKFWKATTAAAPYVGAAAGAAVGGPQGAEAGYKMGKAIQGPQVKTSHKGGPAMTVPSSSGSLGEARQQDRARMRQRYPGLIGDDSESA